VVSLVPCDADDVRLDRLLQLYMHEWSALIPIALGADARYVYADLPAWADRARHAAYLFVDDDVPIGFALIAADDDRVWHVEEYFVVAGARRRGAGAALAARLFATRPGGWTFTVRPENPAALRFWRRAAPGAVETVELGADGVARTRLRFVVG
jgi:predicted acetyltransferase